MVDAALSVIYQVTALACEDSCTIVQDRPCGGCLRAVALPRRAPGPGRPPADHWSAARDIRMLVEAWSPGVIR
jgi:hypothetical protein